MNVQTIPQLRKKKFTFQEIADKFGVTRQRVHQLLYADKYKIYQKTYQKTDKYKVYHRHLYHQKVNRKFSNCEKCIV